jgi:hypothetical protein
VAGRVYLDLQKRARKERRTTDELLLLYAFERFLYRVSISKQRDAFVLKGGMLLAAFDVRRPTQDIDLLARAMKNDSATVERAMRDIAEVVVDDGIVFGGNKVRSRIIREGDAYAGVRLAIPAELASAKMNLQLDVNFGDPVTPRPRTIEYPVLLAEHEPFSLLGYPLETVLAEKIETMLRRGDANTRWRDFADVMLLIRSHSVGSDELVAALRATAGYRGTALTSLDAALERLPQRGASRWGVFRRSHHLDSLPERFSEVVAAVRAFADPVLVGALSRHRWDPIQLRWTLA